MKTPHDLLAYDAAIFSTVFTFLFFLFFFLINEAYFITSSVNDKKISAQLLHLKK